MSYRNLAQHNASRTGRRSAKAARAHSPHHPRLSLVASTILLAGALLFLAGCGSPPADVPPPSRVIEQTELAIQAQKDRLASLPPEHPGRIEAEKIIGTLETQLADYKAKVEAQEKAGVHPDDAAAIGAVQVVSKFAGPFGVIADVAAVLAIPAIGGWIRERRRAKAGEELAKSLQNVASANGGQVDFTDDAHRDQLKAEMSAGARALVERAGAKIPRPRATKAKPKPATKRKPKAKAETVTP